MNKPHIQLIIIKITQASGWILIYIHSYVHIIYVASYSVQWFSSIYIIRNWFWSTYICNNYTYIVIHIHMYVCTYNYIYYYLLQYIKLNSCLSVCSSVCLSVTPLSQKYQHRLKRNLLEMKAESSGTSEYVFISLNMPVFIHTSAQKAVV